MDLRDQAIRFSKVKFRHSVRNERARNFGCGLFSIPSRDSGILIADKSSVGDVLADLSLCFLPSATSRNT